ncbi:hypothetical protein Tsubulata_035408, partial [Turnera subulata]
MARAKKSKEEGSNESQNPEVLERKRLKSMAFSKGILSQAPTPAAARSQSYLHPSKTALKHHGADILRKSQRKNRFLFSFPGLLAPVASGGKIGELKDLSSKNPVLYLHFPQGQMKLFGTIVYPKNRYLSLQFSRGGKNVMCDDYFDNMIVFSDAWWIGTKEENPEEARLDFPKELMEGQGAAEYDFKGGAGAATVNKQVVPPSRGAKYVEEDSPETELEDDDLSDDKDDVKVIEKATPTRHSERTAGKTFKFAEVSSADDSIESNTDDSKEDEDEDDKEKVKPDIRSAVLDIDTEDAIQGNSSAVSVTKAKKLSESAVSVETSVENSRSNRGSLVQSTISTLFKKVQDKLKVEEKAGGPKKRGKVTSEEETGKRTKGKEKVYEVEDDDIEEFSSPVQDDGDSDEDWEA